MCPWCPSWSSVSAWLMKEVTRGQLPRIRRCGVVALASCSVCAGHSAPQAWSDEPASALGRVATPCLEAGAGRWTWEQRTSWTLDETGNRAHQCICTLSTLGIGAVRKIRRGHGGVGMMECRMISVGGRDSKRKRCPGSRDPSYPEPWGAHA